MVKKIAKKADKEEEISVITEAIYLGKGNFKYVVSSTENLKLGLCNISN